MQRFDDSLWWTLWLNPEPWAIGSVSGKRIAPNPGLVAYQSAVREAMQGEPELPKDYRKIEFRFWRRVDKYVDMKDHIRTRNEADATNMQKALEDALQGILFPNDREVKDIRSIIGGQGPDVEPLILIRASRLDSLPGYEDIPDEILETILQGRPTVAKQPDRYADAEELF